MKASEQDHNSDKTEYRQKISELEKKRDKDYSILAKAKKRQTSVNLQDTLKLALVG